MKCFISYTYMVLKPPEVFLSMNTPGGQILPFLPFLFFTTR